jgi:hypothetical protein
LPAMPPDTLSPDDIEPAQESRRPRRRSSTRPVTDTPKAVPAPLSAVPGGAVKLAVRQADEPVVFRRTTVELLPPTDSEKPLLTPPSFPKGK